MDLENVLDSIIKITQESHTLELHFPETTRLSLGILRKWIYTKNELIKVHTFMMGKMEEEKKEDEVESRLS